MMESTDFLVPATPPMSFGQLVTTPLFRLGLNTGIESDSSVAVFIRHTRLSSPAQIVMEYLEKNETITNVGGRNITGLRRDVQMKGTFVLLRRRGLIEQVPGNGGRATAWRRTQNPKGQ